MGQGKYMSKKTLALYFDCASGAAGDMLLAAVLDVCAEIRAEGHLFLRKSAEFPRGEMDERLKSWYGEIEGFLSLERGARIEVSRVIRSSVQALKVDFFVGETHADSHRSSLYSHHQSGYYHGHIPAREHTNQHEHQSGHHHHRSLHDIERILEQETAHGRFSDAALNLSTKIFHIIASAEARVHGTDIEQVHFHEVGAFDSIMDIAGFSAAFCMLNTDLVHASPPTVGSGSVQTAHGLLAVPAPAVVEILRCHKIPVGDKLAEGERLTPTGAAILAAIVDEWGPLPPFRQIHHQGMGAGTRDIPGTPNVVRLISGEL